VAPTDDDEYTQARTTIDFRVLGVDDRADVGRSRLHIGALQVTEQVTGYQRVAIRNGEVIERVALDLPPTELTTRAFWYTIEPAVLARAGVSPEAVPGTLHAAEHAGIGILPLFTICDRWDVGGVSTV